MSFLTAIVSSTINLISAEAYKRHITKNNKQLLGVAVASLLHSTRPLTEQHLKKRFGDRNFNYIYGASSMLIMGVASHFARIPLKVNILSTSFFTILQIVSYNADSMIPTIQLPESPPHSIANPPISEPDDSSSRSLESPAIITVTRDIPITNDQLAQYKNDVSSGGKYLHEQIFLYRTRNEQRNQSCATYMYILPGGFMILLAATQGYPAFSYTSTADGTGVKRLWCYPLQTIDLSQEAYNRLIEMSRGVQVTNVDGTSHREQWDLQGIPPCICIEGKWNPTPQPHGTHVDLEILILQNVIQEHEAFKLRMIDPTWQHIEQTPNLRGFSFNHSEARFNIWVHEKNDNVLTLKQKELVSQFSYLQDCSKFIKEFEKEAFLFATTPREEIQKQKLNEWTTLARKIPFPHVAQAYSNLIQLVKAQGCSDQVMERFEQFFRNLPQEACFATDYEPTRLFLDCFREFNEARNDLVREQNHINTDKFKEWLKMLRFVSYGFGTSPELDQLINNSQEYLEINNILRDRKRAPQDPAEKQVLTNRRAELDPILKDGFITFFQTYQQLMQDKGKFIKDIEREIANIEDKQKRLEVFTLCGQPAGNFVVGSHLQIRDGLLDVKKLKALSEMLALIHDSDDQRRTLLKNSERYLQLNEMTTNRQLQQTVLDSYIQDRAQLIPLITNGFNWFFNTYLPSLNGRCQTDFFKELRDYAECPRSYVESTAQIEFYSKLDRSDLHLIIYRNRISQIASLLRWIDPHITNLPDKDYLQPFFDKFQHLYAQVANFAVRKSQALEIELIPSHEYNDSDGLHTEYKKRKCDGRKYTFEKCQSRNEKDIFRLLNDAIQKLQSLYANVNQENYAAYCSSPFLEEEVELVEDLYAIIHELFFLFKIPIRWYSHLQLHKNSVETKKAKAALVERDYFIYKRVENSGEIASDVVRNHEVSELSKREDAHAAIYSLYQVN